MTYGLEYMIDTYPNGIDNFCGWYVDSLSENPNLTLKVVENNIKGLYEYPNLKKQWNIELLSKNPAVTSEFLRKYPNGINNVPWHIKNLSNNPSVLDYIEETVNYINWDMENLSANKGLTIAFVERNIKLDWNMKNLSSNTNITPYFVQKYIKGINGKNWNVDELSSNPSITCDFIEKNIKGINGVPWNIDNLSKNSSLDLNFVTRYPNGLNGNNWNMRNLSKNKVITPDFVLENPNGFGNEKWNMYHLSANESIPMKFILDNIRGISMLPWDLAGLSKNPNLNPLFFEKYPNLFMWNIFVLTKLNLSNYPRFLPMFNFLNCLFVKVMMVTFVPIITSLFKNPIILTLNDWDYDSLSSNSTITPNIIVKYPKVFNSWFSLSKNTSIDFDSIQKYPALLEKIQNSFLSKIAPYSYIIENPSGYGKLNWDMRVLSKRSWIDKKLSTKSSRNILTLNNF